MAEGHGGRGPEGKDHAHIERMTHKAIGARGDKRGMRVRFSPQVEPDLTGTERSKWLIRNVVRTMPIHPAAARTWSIVARIGDSIVQIAMGMGRHCQKSRISTRLVASTNVLRSTGCGTNLVHHRLKVGRAMMLCWIPKAAIKQEIDHQGQAEGPFSRVIDRLGNPDSRNEAGQIQ